MYAPGKTPVAIVNRPNREIVRFLNTADAKEKYLGFGASFSALLRVERLGSSSMTRRMWPNKLNSKSYEQVPGAVTAPGAKMRSIELDQRPPLRERPKVLV